MKNKIRQVSISVPTELVKAIDELAKAENRARSNFIADTMAKLVREKKMQAIQERK